MMYSNNSEENIEQVFDSRFQKAAIRNFVSTLLDNKFFDCTEVNSLANKEAR